MRKNNNDYMAVQIKRDWAGRPIEITFADKKSKNFYIAYIDDVGVFNEEMSIDKTLLPFFIGASIIRSRLWEREYNEGEIKKKDLKDRVVQTPRDRWDKVDKDKRHPYDYVVSEVDKKIEEEKDGD